MLATLIVAVVGVGVIALFVELAGVDTVGDTPPGVTIGGTYVQDLALIGSALVLARLLDPPPTPDKFGLRLTALRPAIGWTLVSWFAFFAFATVWGLALGITEQDDLPDELGVDGSTAALVAVSLLVCVVAPISEELFFRGFCFTALRRALGMLPAAALTGIIFGAIHLGGTDIEFIVPLMVFGFLLCLLYVWTDSLLPCIVLHALNNALALGVSEDWGAATVLAMAGAGALSAIVVLPFARRAGAPAVRA
jgi:membrane protease YdiL (CAAX protease family)